MTVLRRLQRLVHVVFLADTQYTINNHFNSKISSRFTSSVSVTGLEKTSSITSRFKIKNCSVTLRKITISLDFPLDFSV